MKSLVRRIEVLEDRTAQAFRFAADLYNCRPPRFAFEFFSRVTELNPTPARILPFNNEKGKKRLKSHD